MPPDIGKAFLVQLLVEYHHERVAKIEAARKSPVILTEQQMQELQNMKAERDSAEHILASLGFKTPRELDLPVIYHMAG